ncbi:MAG: hypothetical protein ABSF26_17990 [Thermoguttaceae bacterium]|jgi:hypothetical protein
MSRKPVSARAMLLLIAGGLLLPIVISVLLALAALLGAMGDSTGGLVVRYLALACGAGWTILLICLILVLGLNSLGDRDETGK